eukprot:g29750.t2
METEFLWQVICDSGLELDYDHLVVAVGAQPNTFGIPGVDTYGRFLKEIEHGRRKSQEMLDIIERAEVTLVEALPSLLTMFDKLSSKVCDGQKSGRRKSSSCDRGRSGGYGLWYPRVGGWSGDATLHPCTLREDRQGTWADRPARARGGRMLVVDECLRVRGTRPGEVFAVGDCAVSGKPPTAQVAYQQGKYLGRMFRLGKEHLITDPKSPPFKYCHQGTMAYIGDSQGAAEIDPNSFIKPLGVFAHDVEFDEIVLQLCNGIYCAV